MSPQEDILLDKMKRLSDIPVALRAELDQTTLTFGEVLDLEVGSVIRLPRATGENIDVYVENVLIGWGEMLFVDGALTVRLADLRNAHLPSLQEEEESEPSPAQEKTAREALV
jgi:flagellar motor switch protein FliN